MTWRCQRCDWKTDPGNKESVSYKRKNKNCLDLTKVCADLVVQEGETFDLEHIKALRVGRWGVTEFARPNARGCDSPLELQNSVTHVHLTQVPEVMSAFISAQITALENTTLQQVISHYFIIWCTVWLLQPWALRPGSHGESSTGTFETGSRSVRWSRWAPETS